MRRRLLSALAPEMRPCIDLSNKRKTKGADQASSDRLSFLKGNIYLPLVG